MLAAGGGNAAHAQVRVEGHPDAVHIEVRDVPLRQVLDALQAKFDLRYHTTDVLGTPVTGDFNGSLRPVAERILDGYDFVLKITPEGIDVLVLRQHQRDDEPVVAAMPARAPAPVMTAQQANRYERANAR